MSHPRPARPLPLEDATPPPDPHARHGGTQPMPGMSVDPGPIQPWSWQPDWFWLTMVVILLATYTIGRTSPSPDGASAGRSAAPSASRDAGGLHVPDRNVPGPAPCDG